MFLLFDIGGTKMRLAVSIDGRSFESPVILVTPIRYKDGLAQFLIQARRLTNGRPLQSIVGGVPGTVDRDHRRILRAPHLSDWVGKPFAKDLCKALKADVRLENDATLVGLGEAVYGAGKGYAIVVYLTVSTGVGGVRIVHQEIDAGALGFEPGHQIIDFQGKRELEDLVSGTAIRHIYKISPSEVRDQKVWETLGKTLAVGLTNTILHWSPDVVVLGGSMIVKRPGIPLDVVKREVKKCLKIFPRPPQIKKASLKDVGGLYGALALLRHQRD